MKGKSVIIILSISLIIASTIIVSLSLKLPPKDYAVEKGTTILSDGYKKSFLKYYFKTSEFEFALEEKPEQNLFNLMVKSENDTLSIPIAHFDREMVGYTFVNWQKDAVESEITQIIPPADGCGFLIVEISPVTIAKRITDQFQGEVTVDIVSGLFCDN